MATQSTIPAPIMAMPTVVVGGPTGPSGGPTGPTGPATAFTGPTGRTGPTGPLGTGPTGAAATGVTGPTGRTGPPGSGLTGPTGVTGATGSASTGNFVSKNVASPAGTTSTTGVMMGLAVAFTPQRSGNCLIIFTGMASNSTIGDGVVITGRIGTGSAPTNGAAITGSALTTTAQAHYVAPTAATAAGWTIATTQGLAVGTPYWLDVAVAAITGGTATVTDLQVVVVEL